MPVRVIKSYNSRRTTLIAFAMCGVVACTGIDSAGHGEWRIIRHVAGDTTVVRNVGGNPAQEIRTTVAVSSFGQVDGPDELMFGNISEIELGWDGRILLFDRDFQALRVYDSSGAFVRQVGRPGEGPGEYGENAAGIVALRGGQLGFWEVGTGRLTMFDSSGIYIGTHRLGDPSAFAIANAYDALYSDSSGFGYVRTWVAKDSAGKNVTGLRRFDQTGAPLDSLLPPTFGLKPVTLTASSAGGFNSSSVPYLPQDRWAWSPFGYFVAGRSDEYAVHLIHPDGAVSRIELEVDPVPVHPGQRAEKVESILRNMRSRVPSWQWRGPEIPSTKPYYDDLAVGQDGRIWVTVTGPTEELPDSARPTRVPPEGGAPQPYGSRYREPRHYDVFEPSGEYLGRVRPPPGYMFAMRDDYIWTITRDANGVQSVTKFRVEPPFGRR